ncbi:ABC transporter ATP-binding protein [Pseudomonas sp. CGJS7]|uniref:ABC transporter ATP-binding protein n=1 Tax=Pseudomonas sp. CGJS7 TaxID=3109348 RepID=UPI00300A8967
MARILLKDCSLHLPIYGTINRSLKGAMLASATGGRVATESRDIVVIEALKNVNLDIRPGDRVGVMGHNGAGKTSLLRLLAGIYEPTSGGVLVEGKVSSLLDVTLGMDFEATGYENILLRGLMQGLEVEEIKRLTPSIVEFSGLGEFLNVPVRTYSSGMVLRLAFSIITSVPAEILLMDEWLSVGDADFVHRAEERLKGLVREASILVLASHSREVVQHLCNVHISMEHGEVVSMERVPNQAEG